MNEQAATVLLVDDESEFRAALANTLRRLGYRPVEAGSLEQALARLDDRAVDVILCDLVLGDGSGHQLVREAQTRWPDLPVVAMSGVGTVDDVVVFLRGNAKDYLQKPFRPAELAAALERALRDADSGEAQAPAGRGTRPTLAADPPTAAPEPRAHRSRFASRARPSEPPAEDPLDAALRALREGKVQLPPLSPLWERVEALRADRHTRLEDVVKFVSEEPALAARLLQVTNSSQLGGRRPVTNLRAACLRAGNDAVLEAARVVLLESSFDLTSGPHAEAGRLLWRHVVTCSRICGQLAPFARLDPATASLAGLLHNVGELVIFAALADVPGLRFDPPHGPLCAFLRAHHEAVGARLLDGWGMPSAIVAVARHHHAPPRSPETDGARRLRALVHAGWVGAFDAAGDYLGWTADEQSPPDLAALGIPESAWANAVATSRLDEDE